MANKNIAEERVSEKLKSQNVLEWLSFRGFPDSIKTLVVGLVAAMTVAPYLGGSSIWFAGSSPLTIPTISADWFWKLVFIAPLLWCLLILRFIHTSLIRTISILIIGVSISCVVVVGHKFYPKFAISSLNSMRENFDKTYRLNFLDTQHTWDIAHKIHNGADQYCYFRTQEISLGNEIKKGCVLRISKIEIESNGFANVMQHGAAFDLETHIGTSAMMPKTTTCVPWSKKFFDELNSKGAAQVQGKAVIEVRNPKLSSNENVKYSLMFDFENEKTSASPALKLVKDLSRKDILVVKDKKATLQVLGWTLWGEPCHFRLEDISVHVKGRLQCGFWF